MKKGLWMVLVMIVIHSYYVVNANYEGFIGNNSESEFSFDSHVNRMLYDVSLSLCGKTGNSNNKAVLCPEFLSYRSCLPEPNGGGPRRFCADYTRGC
ncbi:hypothetical protein LR48_Vigan10g241300 [Vigna angularis]|uniref:Uncharacterized protein n=2 Tax=Phaseolus angularis TaxID=3914 RepID=A0A0L9VN94_PHAAN|nr:hypothetical protein LR48_Vigan10g241300 [Vigna angularis]BAU01369.1 hypothetical protein VIGAN_11059200 [Vigna angularis var. angularis]